MGATKFLALVQSFRRNNIKADHELMIIGQLQGPRPMQMQNLDQESQPAIEQICRFGADLEARLQQLQLQGGGGSAHLNWLLDACTATLSTHSSLSSSLLSLPTTTPCYTATQRADEVLSLLDLCTSLVHMADDVDRQLSLLQRALHTAAQALQHKPQGSSATLLHTAARRLRRCLDGLHFLETPRSSSKQSYKPLAEAHAALLLAAKRVVQKTPAAAATSDSATGPALNNALDGTLLISLLLLASILSSFAAPCTTRSSGAMRTVCKLIARYYVSTCKSKSSGSSTRDAAEAASSSWVVPLRQLQQDLKQEEMSCVFLEIQRLQASASSLHNAFLTSSADPRRIVNVAELRHSVDSLHKSSQEAQACITELRSHLASLFQALLALRLALLPC